MGDYDIPGEQLGKLPVLSWSGPDIGANVAITVTQAKMIIPFKCKLIEVQFASDTAAGTALPHLDVRLAGTATTILNAVAQLTAAQVTAYATPLAAYQWLAKGTELDLNIFTHAAGGGDCNKPTVNLVLQRADVGYAGP